MSRPLLDHGMIGCTVQSKKIGARAGFVGVITEAWVTPDGHPYFVLEDPADGSGWHRIRSDLNMETLSQARAA